MANLYSGVIKSNGNYKDLSVESGIAFQVDHDYQVQFFNKGYIREGENGVGFCIYDANPFTIRFKGDPIYVSSTGKLEINIAE
jgi:hypothetical protein